MYAILVGLNYKSAAVSIREKLHFDNNMLSSALSHLFKRKGVEECAILSTCNRVELYACTNDITKGFDLLKSFLAEHHRVNEKEIEPYLYKLAEKKAVRHLFRVASSLDSMVLGENQILGQVKRAYDDAYKQGCTKSILNVLFQKAISTGKKVRSETAIGEGSLSIASVAVDLVKDIFPQDYTFNVCIIGAGEVSELVTKSLQQQYKNINLTIVNRNFKKAVSLAKKFNSSVSTLKDVYSQVLRADVSIVSTSSKEFIVRSDLFYEHLRQARSFKLRFLIDLSVPRNVDPQIQNIDDTVVYAIDDLKKIIDKNFNKRQIEIKDSEKLILNSVNDFFIWYYKRQIISKIDELTANHSILLDKFFFHTLNLTPQITKTIQNIAISSSSNWEKIIATMVGKLQHVEELKEILNALEKVQGDSYFLKKKNQFDKKQSN